MTDEAEAVALSPSAKAVNDLLIDLFPHWDWDQRECIASLAAREAITALDKHRIERAGEVDRKLIASTAQRTLGGDLCFASVALIQEAAATIASLRAEIERLTEREAQDKLDGVRAGIEAAEQRCRYVGKHNSDRQEEGLYRDGFEVACEVCEQSISALSAEAIAKGEG